MKTFKNILFVSRGVEDLEPNLKQVFPLAEGNSADLCVQIIYPSLPENLAQYKAKWEDSLINEARQAVDNVRGPNSSVAVEVVAESADLPAETIIRRVLREGHDLLFKEAEPRVGGVGHQALDMDLLRKCPCPVWLSQPRAGSAADVRVAVAIDPENQEPAAKGLAQRMLKTAFSLASACATQLQIVSCWDCEYESFLLHNPFANIPADEVARTVIAWERSHSAALVGLIAAAGLSGDYHVHHVRGRPEEVIPDFIDREKIDILIMGTVARTGIPGFIMGNTAENIVQKLQCSLLALKPGGFVSPVKAY